MSGNKSGQMLAHPGAGLTFKENCPDLRNWKVADVVRELQSYGARWTCAIPGSIPTRPSTNTASAP